MLLECLGRGQHDRARRSRCSRATCRCRGGRGALAAHGRRAGHAARRLARCSIRPVQPEDKELFVARLGAASATSRATAASWAPRASLSARELAYFTEIDHVDHEAIGARDRGRPARASASRATCALPTAGGRRGGGRGRRRVAAPRARRRAAAAPDRPGARERHRALPGAPVRAQPQHARAVRGARRGRGPARGDGPRSRSTSSSPASPARPRRRAARRRQGLVRLRP